MTESAEERQIGRLATLAGCMAPVVLVVAALRVAGWVTSKRQAAWLRGRSWPPEALGIFLRGAAPRRAPGG